MKKVYANFSFGYYGGLDTVLAQTFPNANITNKFSLQREKCPQVISHGLAPYFKDILMKKKDKEYGIS